MPVTIPQVHQGKKGGGRKKRGRKNLSGFKEYTSPFGEGKEKKRGN